MPCPISPPTRNTKSFSTPPPPGRNCSLRMKMRRQAMPQKKWVAFLFSWQIPRARRLAHLLKRGHVIRKRLAIRKLVRTVSTLRIEIIEQAGGAPLVGILADVPRFDRLIHIAALIELDNLLARAQILISVHHVGQHLLRRLGGKLFV